jgi:SAM-dependent methyltransferase
MRALYGRHYDARMSAVAAQVPPDSAVVELCCGPGTLYARHLQDRVSSYIGLDINPGFVRALKSKGIDAREANLSATDEPLPNADVVLIQASLYHFLPDAGAIVERMLRAAGDRVIIAEPIRNLASSDSRLIGLLGRRAADPGVGGHAHRFTEETLDALLERYRDRLIAAFLIPGGREKVYVIDARPARRSETAAGS